MRRSACSWYPHDVAQVTAALQEEGAGKGGTEQPYFDAQKHVRATKLVAHLCLSADHHGPYMSCADLEEHCRLDLGSGISVLCVKTTPRALVVQISTARASATLVQCKSRLQGVTECLCGAYQA